MTSDRYEDLVAVNLVKDRVLFVWFCRQRIEFLSFSLEGETHAGAEKGPSAKVA